jgi:hypothetical protein
MDLTLPCRSRSTINSQYAHHRRRVCRRGSHASRIPRTLGICRESTAAEGPCVGHCSR